MTNLNSVKTATADEWRLEAPVKKGLSSSLAKSTLLKMGTRIAIVIAVAALISYFHIFSILNEQVEDSLQKYIVERGQKESAIFLHAERNHQEFKQTFLDAWSAREHVDDETRFEELFEHWSDGTWRLHEKAFLGIKRADGTYSRHITGYVGSNAPDTQRFHNKLVLSYDLIDRYADAWTMDYANLYVSMPENVNLVYWPDVLWGMQADSSLEVNVEEWVYIANKENNPSRKPVWTGLYFDPTADEWMVSLATPVDLAGEHLINIGHDILLNTLFDRVFNDRLEGTYNFIFRADGRIIAHPDQVDALRAHKGELHVSEAADPELKHIVDSILDADINLGESGLIIDDEASAAKLAVTKINGPDWFFVTVYPHSLMAVAAIKTVYIVAIVGLVSLILELIILFYVLRRQVLEPVHEFGEFSRSFAAREPDSIDALVKGSVSKRDDEMGMLAVSMTTMATTLKQYEANLERRVEQRTIELDHANEVLQQEFANREQIASLLHTIARDVSGLHGENYFNTLTEFLAESLQGDFVFIGRVSDDKSSVHTLALIIDDQVQENCCYELKGTPCERVVNGGPQCFNGNVQELFPEDKELVRLGLHSYIGTPMVDGKGNVVGHLAVLKRGEFAQNDMVQMVIDSVSSRAAYELMRQVNEEIIMRQATTDSLTKLPNRALFMDRLLQSIQQAERDDNQLAVIFIDVDNFKLVNDQLGHAAGDFVLKTISERLQPCIRKNDTLARLGGDEFIVLLNNIDDIYGPELVARNILKSVSEDICIGDTTITMSCSLGIAIYPNDSEDSDTLIKHADMAMYRAKKLGRNNYQFFTQVMNDDIEESNSLEHDLRQAIANNELEVHYQPIIRLADRGVCKLEALVRWNHPDRGRVMPDQFIPIAERSGLIIQVSEFVLNQACSDYSQFKVKYPELEAISINFSARQFRDQALIERVTSIVASHQLQNDCVEIEITESLFIDGNDTVTIATLHELKRQGFRLSLDDFGTGYSSLGYLKKVPIDTLKIDRSFIRDLTIDPDDLALVSSIIELANSFNLDVIAEGVEDQSQEDILRVEGCEFAQGYYYSRPAPISDLLDYGALTEVG